MTVHDCDSFALCREISRMIGCLSEHQKKTLMCLHEKAWTIVVFCSEDLSRPTAAAYSILSELYKGIDGYREDMVKRLGRTSGWRDD